ncbi:hypothetical protein ACLKA6_006057 [Drosophila palustris]
MGVHENSRVPQAWRPIKKQRPGSKEAAHSPPIPPAEAGQEGPLADHQPPGYELVASPLTNGSVETGLTPPPKAAATWRSRGRRSRADVAPPHTITTGRTSGATIATHTGTPEIGTTITTDIGTIYTSAATTVQAVRRVVGIAWPQDVAQEARRMNVRAADTRNPYNNKDQVPSPGSSKDIPNCPRSNQDQVLSPGSDKDIRNSLGSNQDQVINYQGSIHRPRNSQGPATRLVQGASISPCKDQTISAVLVDAGSAPGVLAVAITHPHTYTPAQDPHQKDDNHAAQRRPRPRNNIPDHNIKLK